VSGRDKIRLVFLPVAFLLALMHDLSKLALRKLGYW
jgi:hypothetical protein